MILCSSDTVGRGGLGWGRVGFCTEILKSQQEFIILRIRKCVHNT